MNDFCRLSSFQASHAGSRSEEGEKTWAMAMQSIAAIVVLLILLRELKQQEEKKGKKL